MKGHPRQRNQEGYNAPIMDNPLEVYPPHTSPYGSFQQQPRMTTEIPQVSPSMGSPYQQNAYQRQAPGNPPFLAHAMPFQTGLPIDQAQTQMVYLSYPNSYPQLIPQIMPQQHQFPAAIPQSRPQFPRYANQSQPFVQPRFSQSNNPAQYFTPFPHTNGQVPLQVPPTTQQPPPQKRERKPLAIVDPNTNEEVSISPDSVSRSRSESTSEGPKQPDNSEQIKVEFAKQVAATIGESPPVDVPSSIESSVVDQQVESELMVPPAFIDTSMPPPLKSAEPTQERPSLLNGVTEELVVPEKKLEEEPAPSIEIVSPSMGSPYQQNAYQRQAPGSPPFLAHAMPFQTGLPIDQAQAQMVYLSYLNSYPQLIPQIIPQQHQFPAAIPQSRPQFPRYANQSQPFVQPRFSQSKNPAQIFTPFPQTNGQVPLQVPPTTQQPPQQKSERKPLAIVDPNTNEEVTKSRDSVSRSRSESTSELLSSKEIILGKSIFSGSNSFILHFQEEERTRNISEELREEKEKIECQRQEEQPRQLHLEEERTLFEEERRKFEQEKRKLKEEAQRKCAEEKELLEKERARKAKEVEKQMEEMDKRKQDIEKQLHEERNRNERLEVEKEHLREEQVRLEKELKVFKEEISKFKQEKLELKREAERKCEQEKKLLKEKWAKASIKLQKQFENARKLLEKERAEKVEELEKQLEEVKQRTRDNEKQMQQEREKTERKKEVEEQNLYRGLLRLREERKLFEEEMRKFDQEKMKLEEEAERKSDQEKRLLEERARLVEELKKQLEKEQHFQEEKERQEQERRKKQQQEEKRREAEEEKRKKAINEEICRIEEERRRLKEEKQQAEEKKIKEEEIRLLKVQEEWLKSKHKEEMSLLEKKRNDALKQIQSQTTHRNLTLNSSLVKNDSSLDETTDADHIEDALKEEPQKGLNPALSEAKPENSLHKATRVAAKEGINVSKTYLPPHARANRPLTCFDGISKQKGGNSRAEVSSWRRSTSGADENLSWRLRTRGESSERCSGQFKDNRPKHFEECEHRDHNECELDRHEQGLD
ncbi:histone-lysine N-methyltransferase, H3 lysine-79 specific-like [Artemia franciscana]|uniref:histone-lysine N-methyltransferase, H3 lysine-79 specific-like n=1 Tax=Artemia franciscana TaxID=6661 RepID=UPI0032DA9B4B